MPPKRDTEDLTAERHFCPKCHREFISKRARSQHVRIVHEGGKGFGTNAPAVGNEGTPLSPSPEGAPTANPRYGEPVEGREVECQGTCDPRTKVPLAHGEVTGSFIAECPKCGSKVVYPVGSVVASEMVLRLNESPSLRSSKEIAGENPTGEEVTTPLEDAIAEVMVETGYSKSRVNSELEEACSKAERHPDESEEEIISRFWDLSDRQILAALVKRGVTFRPTPESETEEERTALDTLSGSHAKKPEAEEEAIAEVATELDYNVAGVSETLEEARAKAERYPDETEDKIIARFWSGGAQRILAALLARGVAFRSTPGPEEEPEE